VFQNLYYPMISQSRSSMKYESKLVSRIIKKLIILRNMNAFLNAF